MEKTKGGGQLARDPSGLLHYTNKECWHIREAIEDALDNKPDGEPVWFWWNDTPAPILPYDDKDSLYDRWHNWRISYQRDPESLLATLLDFMSSLSG